MNSLWPRDNKHERIARKVTARIREDETRDDECVHLLCARAGEHVHGRALLDLFLQDAGCAEVEAYARAGALFVELADLCEGILETDGGRDGKLCGARDRCVVVRCCVCAATGDE